MRNPMVQVLISAAAARDYPPERLIAQAWLESNFDAAAKSPAGAVGLMQFEPATASQFGIDPLDPAAAAGAACSYMMSLLVKYDGNLARALAAYNWGEGHLDECIRAHDGMWLDFVPGETLRYVDDNLAYAMFAAEIL